ncbi:MAG: 50S ribosomal protein L4 [Nitrospirae bacterium]|nr:MAG: 50S ribosomal protein L4 [Nitrospirota bacterium]
MAVCPVVDIHNRQVRTVELAPEIFEAEPHQGLVHAAVVMQQAASRQGTASTKGRGEVSGAGRKPWRQKHTGRARAGSIRSPIWRHGGVVFGPRPRQYGFPLPKKMYRIALKSALASKRANGELIVLDALPLPEPKTRYVASALRQLGLERTTLFVVGPESSGVKLAARNIPGVKVVEPHELNVYDVLRYDALLVLENQLAKIQELWA